MFHLYCEQINYDIHDLGPYFKNILEANVQKSDVYVISFNESE